MHTHTHTHTPLFDPELALQLPETQQKASSIHCMSCVFPRRARAQREKGPRSLSPDMDVYSLYGPAEHPPKGPALAFWHAWHIVWEKRRRDRWKGKRVSVLTDQQTCKTDRWRKDLSAKVFSVHSYEKEYSLYSPPFYLLLVFTLVSFLVNLVHECRSSRWVGRDFPLILTSSPIPDCILIPPELLNQCKTNTNCHGCSSLLEKYGLGRLGR